jgi:hypothetical protein
VPRRVAQTCAYHNVWLVFMSFSLGCAKEGLMVDELDDAMALIPCKVNDRILGLQI